MRVALAEELLSPVPRIQQIYPTRLVRGVLSKEYNIFVVNAGMGRKTALKILESPDLIRHVPTLRSPETGGTVISGCERINSQAVDFKTAYKQQLEDCLQDVDTQKTVYCAYSFDSRTCGSLPPECVKKILAVASVWLERSMEVNNVIPKIFISYDLFKLLLKQHDDVLHSLQPLLIHKCDVPDSECMDFVRMLLRYGLNSPDINIGSYFIDKFPQDTITYLGDFGILPQIDPKSLLWVFARDTHNISLVNKLTNDIVEFIFGSYHIKRQLRRSCVLQISECLIVEGVPSISLWLQMIASALKNVPAEDVTLPFELNAGTLNQNARSILHDSVIDNFFGKENYCGIFDDFFRFLCKSNVTITSLHSIEMREFKDVVARWLRQFDPDGTKLFLHASDFISWMEDLRIVTSRNDTAVYFKPCFIPFCTGNLTESTTRRVFH